MLIQILTALIIIGGSMLIGTLHQKHQRSKRRKYIKERAHNSIRRY